MFRRSPSVILIAAALALGACQPAAAPKSTSETAAKTTPAAEALGDFKKSGTVLEVGDAGYPMFVLKVDFGDGQPPKDLLFNNEAVKTEGLGEDIATAKGKAVEVAYSRKPEMDLLTLTYNGKDVIAGPTPAAPATPDGTVTGLLSGAGLATAGDLPDVITITDSNGKAYNFEWFITEDGLIAANGKQVTAGFRADVREEITALRATK